MLYDCVAGKQIDGTNIMPFTKQLSGFLMLAALGLISIPSYAACVEDATTLCLNSDRFRVEVAWRDEAQNPFTIADDNRSGAGQAVPLKDETGAFWLFTDRHHEILIKVLNGCSFNNRFWVFAATTTNVEYAITVTDTAANVVRVYSNAFGNAAVPIADTSAFATCDADPATQAISTKRPDTPSPVTAKAEPGSCVADATTMCMHDSRFSVTVDWRDFTSGTGQGRAENLGDESGHFWFFSPSSLDLLVNIYDGGTSNGSYWVFFAATTNVEYTLSVTDTRNGVTKQYTKPLGIDSVTLDNKAFPSDATPIPAAPPVVEFYNTNLDHYFITADANEAAAVDNGGAGPGWSRTAGTFRSGGNTAVCRFYGSQSPGPNSHFYTADADECTALKQLQASTPVTEKRWNFESLDFLTTVPVGGACPTGTTEIYRAYNNGFARGVDSNHRISGDPAAIQEVVTRGWSDEGVVMCAPQ